MIVKVGCAFLAFTLLVSVSCMTDEEKAGFKIIRFHEHGEESHHIFYQGERFLVEIEEPVDTNIHWKLYHGEHITTLESLEMIHPLNLDEGNSGEYYVINRGGREIGVYVFKFEVDKLEEGAETLNFVLEDYKTKKELSHVYLYASILPKRDEL